MKHLLRVPGALALIATLLTLHAALPAGSTNLRVENSIEAAHSSFESTGVTVLQADASGLKIELVTSPFSIAADGNLKVDGLDYVISDPGAPRLPYYSTLIALPPGADVMVSTTQNKLTAETPLDVPAVPRERLEGEASVAEEPLPYAAGSLHELPPIQEENPQIYGANASYPGYSFTVSQPMYVRDLRLIELRLFPVQYNPVEKTVFQATRITADIHFLHPEADTLKQRIADESGDTSGLRAQIINYDQASSWRSLPQTMTEQDLIQVPPGRKAFKVEVNQDGIYELAGSDLAAKGMDLPVEPQTIQMMQRGKQVSFQFIDTNSNQQFDAGDKLRFYGWSFDGTRQEKMYVSDNIFWLWTQDSGTIIPTVENQAGSGSTVTSFRDSVTRWEEKYYSSGWSVTWNENDPTTWHTKALNIEPGATKTENIAIDLPYPDPNGGDPTYVVELTTRLRKPLSGSSTISFVAETRLNDANQFGERSWIGPKNLNVSSSAAAGVLKQPGEAGYPTNQIELKLSSSSPTPLFMLLTRTTVDYARQLIAVNDYLSFRGKETGPSTFKLSGFTNGDSNNVLAWDISNKYQPRQIKLNPTDISGSGSNHIYMIGTNHGTNAQFVVTTSSNLLKVQSIEPYVGAAIDPAVGGAAWLAISHASLKGAAESLASHRRSEMAAYVVDIRDVVNQVGYGFHTPETIREYLRYAIGNWNPAPIYVTLFGDATNNPRQLGCTECGSSWDKDTPNLIATDFVFVDRWQGMVPSDFALSLLFGQDLLADIAISRFPANTLAEANAMVQKVITYEMQRAGDNPQSWTKNLLFIADNKDNGGDFCSQNKSIGPLISPEYNQTHLCLEEPTPANIANLRSEMRKEISDDGVSIANYRGHGSTSQWGGFNNEPAILSSDDVDFWENAGRSVVLLSADCLDGYFILNGESALGETFMRLNNRGSVAHWSSAGIGYSSEHSVLHRAFYEGIFRYNQNFIGDAVNFAKTHYYQAGRHPSELYSFVLLGDAAMAVVPKQELRVFMPVAYTP